MWVGSLIKQGVCPRDIKNAAFVYRWEFAQEKCPAVIRKVNNAVFVYFWEVIILISVCLWELAAYGKCLQLGLFM